MNKKGRCLIFICVCGLISSIQGQTFPNFGQFPPTGQGNPALFQQFLQTRQTAGSAGGSGATTGNGFPGQGQIRTVTVPILPAPGADFNQGLGMTQFTQTSTQNQGTSGQIEGPIPRFAQGSGIGRPFTQFSSTQVSSQGGPTGAGNAAMMAARQRQMAMMRQAQAQAMAQAQAQAQAMAQGQGRQTAGAAARSPFSRLGLGENGQMLVLSNRAVDDIRAGRNIDRRGILTQTENGRSPSLLTAFALQSDVLNGRSRAALIGQRQNGRPGSVTTRTIQTSRTTGNQVVPGGAAQARLLASRRNGVTGAQQSVSNGATQRTNRLVRIRSGGTTSSNGAALRTNGAATRTVNVQRTTQGASRRQETQVPFMPQRGASVLGQLTLPRTQDNSDIDATQRQQMQNQQQALARIRAAGGLPPFAFMGGQGMPGMIRPPFGMLPVPNAAMQANATETQESAGALWRPDVRMPGMMPPPFGMMPPPGFPGMFPPGFVGGPIAGPGADANRIIGSRTAGATGFTGASNALVPDEPTPIINPRGASAARAAANRLNGVSTTVTRTETNNVMPSFPAVGAAADVEAFPGAVGARPIPQNVAVFPGSGSTSVTTVTETKVATNSVPREVAAFPGSESTAAGSSSSFAATDVNVPAFPGMETGSVTDAGVPDFPVNKVQSVDSSLTTVDSGTPMSFSLKVQGEEQPFGPGELPPPPPVFPAMDINNIPESADAALFGTTSGNSGSSTITGSSSSTSGQTGGSSKTTVEVTKFVSRTSSSSNTEFPSFPAASASETASNTGIYQRGNGLVMAVLDLTNADNNNLSEMMHILQNLIDERKKVNAAPVVEAQEVMAAPGSSITSTRTGTSISSFPSFPGADVNPGGVPIQI